MEMSGQFDAPAALPPAKVSLSSIGEEAGSPQSRFGRDGEKFPPAAGTGTPSHPARSPALPCVGGFINICCAFCGCHGGVLSSRGFQGCDSMWCGRVPKFQVLMLLPSSGWTLKTSTGTINS
jgi:hypothetical protein